MSGVRWRNSWQTGSVPKSVQHPLLAHGKGLALPLRLPSWPLQYLNRIVLLGCLRQHAIDMAR